MQQQLLAAALVVLACTGCVRADLLQLAKVQQAGSVVLHSSMQMVQQRPRLWQACHALTLPGWCSVLVQANPSAAYGAWMKLHGKEEVNTVLGVAGCPMPSQHHADAVEPSAGSGTWHPTQIVSLLNFRVLPPSLTPSRQTWPSSIRTTPPTPLTRYCWCPLLL